MLPADVSERKQALQELSSVTPEGRKRRVTLQTAVRNSGHEFHGLGVEMNQHYDSDAIYPADETHPFSRTGSAAENDVLYHDPNTYPGCRLPHVWLNTAIPKERVSTIDLAGHGVFTLFTGIGGEDWKEAAVKVAERLRVPLKVHSIGFRRDWEDIYLDWERVRGVEESGAVLVRPDRFVAWRASAVLPDVAACELRLVAVIKSILRLE